MWGQPQETFYNHNLRRLIQISWRCHASSSETLQIRGYTVGTISAMIELKQVATGIEAEDHENLIHNLGKLLNSWTQRWILTNGFICKKHLAGMA
jgi:hypothetical protein